MNDEKNKYEIKAVLKADTSQIKQVQKKLDQLCRMLEKANSLSEELASKEIVIGITSELRQPCHNVGKHWLRGLRQRFSRNADK
ncbi:MAG: hypothetical protein Q4A32_03540 [Lachnospiraceae bacterium]|nr:hypothetical protein [Lachnospiraceae bacterium]